MPLHTRSCGDLRIRHDNLDNIVRTATGTKRKFRECLRSEPDIFAAFETVGMLDKFSTNGKCSIQYGTAPLLKGERCVSGLAKIQHCSLSPVALRGARSETGRCWFKYRCGKVESLRVF